MDNVLRGSGASGRPRHRRPSTTICTPTSPSPAPASFSTDAMKSLEDTKSATAVSNAARPATNILCTWRSSAMRRRRPGTIITTPTPLVTYRLVIDATVGVLSAAALVWVKVRVRKTGRSRRVFAQKGRANCIRPEKRGQPDVQSSG